MAETAHPSGDTMPGAKQSAAISSVTEATLHLGDRPWPALSLPAGSLLFARGDPGDCMYRIRSGSIEIILGEPEGGASVIDELGPGDPVGELALLSGQPRSADARAVTDVELDVISRAEFERLAARCPEDVQSFAEAVLPRIRRSRAAVVLTRIFGQLDASELRSVQGRLAWVMLSRDEILFRQGDPSDALYIIVEGRIRYVVREESGREQLSSEAGTGETIGEFGLLTGAPRSATVSAVRDTWLLRMTRPMLEELTREYPHAMLEIARTAFARQQRQVGPEPGRLGAASYVLLATGPGAPLAEAAAALSQELGTYGRALWLSADRVDGLLFRPGLSQIKRGHPVEPMLEGWLNEQERQNAYLVLQADLDASSWTERCLRRADKVVLVGNGGEHPGTCPVAGLLSRWTQPEQTMLLLLQPADCVRPSGTAAWLDRFPVRAHYHVRLSVPGDLAHFARSLTGRALGLVLSGGGARGFAHIGALRALREAGVVIDAISGTSMGALVAMPRALGMDDDAVQELLVRHCSRKGLLDRTLPVVSLYSTGKITNLIRTIAGECDIEDAWLPYFCVSSNLTRVSQMVHRRGSMWKAVRASMAAAPIFAPLVYNGELLVDGGYLNNLPLDVMREQVGPGTVIGVDCNPVKVREARYDFGPSISGLEALHLRLLRRPGQKPPPNMFGLVTGILNTNYAYRLQFVEHEADLILRLPTSKYGFMDFDLWEEIVEVGYQAACEQLEVWFAAGPTRVTEVGQTYVRPDTPDCRDR